MKLVLWFLKKNQSLYGNSTKGDPVVMSAISSDECPVGYRGVKVLVKEEVLEKGLTEDFVEIIKIDKEKK